MKTGCQEIGKSVSPRTAEIFRYILLHTNCSQYDVAKGLVKGNEPKQNITTLIRRLKSNGWVSGSEERCPKKDHLIVNFTKVIDTFLKEMIYRRPEIKNEEDYRKLLNSNLYQNIKIFLQLFFEEYGKKFCEKHFFKFPVEKRNNRGIVTATYTESKIFFLINNLVAFNRYGFLDSEAIDNFYRRYFHFELKKEIDGDLLNGISTERMKGFYRKCNQIFHKINKKTDASPFALLGFLPSLSYSPGASPSFWENKETFEKLYRLGEKLSQLYWNKRIQRKFYEKQFTIYKKILGYLSKKTRHDIKLIFDAFNRGHYKAAAITAQNYLSTIIPPDADFEKIAKDKNRIIKLLLKAIKHSKNKKLNQNVLKHITQTSPR